MTVSKERVADKRTMDEDRTPDETASGEGRTPGEGGSSEGMIPDEGASSEGRTAHEGMSSGGRATSKPATTVKAATVKAAAAKTTVKTAAATKPCLRRRNYQCGAYARRYDRDQFLVDHCFAPAVSRTALTAQMVWQDDLFRSLLALRTTFYGFAKQFYWRDTVPLF